MMYNVMMIIAREGFIRTLKRNRIYSFEIEKLDSIDDVYMFFVSVDTEYMFLKVAKLANETLYKDTEHYNDLVTDSDIYLTWLTHYTTLFPNYNDYIESISYRYKKAN